MVLIKDYNHIDRWDVETIVDIFAHNPMVKLGHFR